MRETDKRYSLKGWMLLPQSSVPGYRGVERHPFEPALFDKEIDAFAQVPEGESRIWVFYPPGWRRDAYRLYEENVVKEAEDDLFLLSSHKVAREIQRIIEPHVGPHEIVTCEILELDALPSLDDSMEGVPNLGYDIAYPGGDFYSAIFNGLLKNPHPSLVAEYKPLLNEFGLFSSMKPIPAYIRRFRELVPSEAYSEFCIFRLSLENECDATNPLKSVSV